MQKIHNAGKGCGTEESSNGLIFKKLLETRTVFISDAITKKLADEIMKTLLILESEGDAPITVFVDSPGGDADAGYAIYDMLRFVKPEIKIICAGLCASAGAIILLAAEKKNRLALPNAKLLIHQPSSGIIGDATDIEIQALEINRLKKKINELISNCTGQTIEKVEKDTDRDYWLSAEESVEYGLVDRIVEKSSDI